MASITLTGKYAKGQFVLIDDEDFKWLNQWKWQLHPSGYAVRSVWQKRLDGTWKHTTIKMHRLINKTPSGLATDHINRVKLDNRRNNLRNATNLQNNQNASIRKDNKSGYKGVCYRPKSRDYVAYIQVNGKRICLKTYRRVEDAITARKVAELKYHKKFALSANGG